ncbi:unnamed protein product, partial [Urochloa humidicola]
LEIWIPALRWAKQRPKNVAYVLILFYINLIIPFLFQWEEILLGIGGEHLEKSNDLSLKVDVEVDVFHVRKGIRRTITLNVELSDGNEVFHSV